MEWWVPWVGAGEWWNWDAEEEGEGGGRANASVLQDETVPEMGGGDGHTAMSMY